MKYKKISSLVIESEEYEMTVAVTLRREDGIEAVVYACAGVPESDRGTADTLGSTSGMESAWNTGDSLDCWCPAEFEEDSEAAGEAAHKAALGEWAGRER